MSSLVYSEKGEYSTRIPSVGMDTKLNPFEGQALHQQQWRKGGSRDTVKWANENPFLGFFITHPNKLFLLGVFLLLILSQLHR